MSTTYASRQEGPQVPLDTIGASAWWHELNRAARTHGRGSGAHAALPCRWDRVVMSDIVTSNGVIHVIDKVILPN